MPLLILRAPDMGKPISLSLLPGAAWLIGREPDPAQVSAEGVDPDRVEVIKISSPQVSRHHAMVQVNPRGMISVQDLGSKHGTWMRLSPMLPVRIGNEDVELELCLRAARADLPPSPADAVWTSAEDFAEGVRAAVQTWLDGRGVRADVTLSRDEPQGERDPWAFGLGDGSLLHVMTPVGWTQPVPGSIVQVALRGYLGRQNALFEEEQGHGPAFILASPAIRRAHREIVDAAARGARVVLLGPRGAGKEELARCYHLHSRPDGPWVHQLCGTLVGDIGYVDLFGAVAGASQGIAAKQGAVEDANHGTLFLDELADLDPKHQSALLGFLNEGRDRSGNRRRGAFYRLGDKNRAQPRWAADVNVVCATNVDLDDEGVRNRHHFRDDLWDRVATCVIRVPPLCERPEDVVAYLESHPHDGEVKLADALTPEARKLALKHRWPGNFREMAAFRQRLPAQLRPRSIDVSACREALRQPDEARPALAAVPEPIAPAKEASDAAEPDWARVEQEATRAFEREKGSTPRTVSDVVEYANRYQKPVFVAHAAGLMGIREVPRGINLSELARKLKLADGTTVRNHLERYVEITRA